ncbi:MAG: DUF2218 domain-containing protein [Chloroflexota bacterium]
MHKAHGVVKTSKATRYMKALCNHFDRKVTAEHDNNHGTVQFGFGDCEMTATDDSLSITVEADNEDHFGRVKYVVGDHLERFSGEDALIIEWQDI